MITIYTDGAYSYHNNVGGWAAIIVDQDSRESEITGSVRHVTSNRMELLAVLEGLFTLSQPTDVKVVTDSKYVEESFNKGWLHKWVEESQFERPHFELWRILYNLDKIHDIKIKWVKGHSGHHYNERCDKLASGEVHKITRVKKKEYYAVAIGREVGIYNTWDECNKQVLKYKRAKYKKFDSHKKALQYVNGNKLINK